MYRQSSGTNGIESKRIRDFLALTLSTLKKSTKSEQPLDTFSLILAEQNGLCALQF